MKKVILLITFLSLWSCLASAQTGVKFGFKAGYCLGTQYGIMTEDINYDVNSSSRSGFTGGFYLLFPITEAFSVQQEFLYTQKGSGQEITMTTPLLNTSTSYKLDYFELPILFRYTFLRIGHFGIYGSSGFSLSTLLKGKYKIDGAIQMGELETPLNASGDTEGLDKFDYSFIYGVGTIFTLFNHECFFDYRQTIGWNTLHMPTLDTSETAPLRNQTYSFTIGLHL